MEVVSPLEDEVGRSGVLNLNGYGTWIRIAIEKLYPNIKAEV